MNTRQSLDNGLASILLVGALFSGQGVFAGPSTNQLKAPVYSSEQVPAFNCSRYARLASKELFGKEYQRADAWNLRYHDKVVQSLGTNTLDNLYDSGTLKPGMIVGVFNPKSKYNDKLDESGKKVKYTHVILFVGEEKVNGKRELKFAHQFGKNFYLESAQAITNRGLSPIEVLDSKK